MSYTITTDSNITPCIIEYMSYYVPFEGCEGILLRTCRSVGRYARRLVRRQTLSDQKLENSKP